MALKAAVEKVIVEHARRGLPIYMLRGGLADAYLFSKRRLASA
jgi:hypothetical protein